MSITLRRNKGSGVSNDEIDDNFAELASRAPPALFDTLAGWMTNGAIGARGSLLVESNTGSFKIADGVSTYPNLLYPASSGGAFGNIDGGVPESSGAGNIDGGTP